MNILKKIAIAYCILASVAVKSQQVILSNTAQINILPGTVLILENGMNLVNNSSGGKINGSCIFRGNLPQNISGSQAIEFVNLTLDQGAMLSLLNDVNVNSTLNLNGGIVNLLNNNLNILSGASIKGSFSETNMIAAEGNGKLSQDISSNGTYLFPIGDTSRIDDYTPATLVLKSGNYNNSVVSVNLRNKQHPNNLKSGNYLERYWTVSQTGITAFDCDVSFTYANEDIKGSESNIYGAKWDGTNWSQLNKGSLNSITGTVNSFGDFTGADQTVLATEDLIQDKVEVLTNGNLIIIKSQDNYKLINAEIFNRLGQKIYEKDLSKSNYNELSLGLSNDIYLLRISSENQTFTKKIVIN